MNWAEYADASRQLSEVYQREAGRRTGVSDRTRTGRASIEQLRKRLDAQRGYLTDLAARVREPEPSFDPSARAGLTDGDEAVRRGWESVELADAEARRAEQRAQQPAILPGAPARVRNAVVYSAATVLAVLASAGLWELNPDARAGRVPLSLLPWSLCGLPALAFFAGYFTIVAFGHSRTEKAQKRDRSVRLGGLICLLGSWLCWLLLVASSAR